MSDERTEIFPRPLDGGPVERLPSALIPARTTLEGQTIALEPMDESVHGDDLYAASHTDEAGLAIWTYLPDGPWDGREAYGAHLRANSGDLTRIFYALRPHGGPACGQASFMDMHAANGVIEIGYIWFGPTLQRTRAATEAMYLMIDYAMTDLGYRRMQWRCNALNAKSRGAALRLGFRFEGIFYNHLIFKGLNRDTAWFSILDDEWPDVRSRMQHWLADDNFDAAGQPKTSLRALMDDRGPSRRGAE